MTPEEIQSELNSEYGDIVRWVEPYAPNLNEIHKFISQEWERVSKIYDAATRRKTVLNRVQEILQPYQEVLPWTAKNIQDKARTAVKGLVEMAGLTLDEIYYLLQTLNTSSRDSTASWLYEDLMLRLLYLPQVNEGFLLFLINRNPENNMSFWVGDTAQETLMKKNPNKWTGSDGSFSTTLRLARRSKLLPYWGHNEYQHITHRSVLYRIAAEELEKSKH